MQRTLGLVCALAVAAIGCSDTEPTPQEIEEQGDDTAALTLEGEQITSIVDFDFVSPSFQSELMFERLGLMWDAPGEGAIELRFSSDGNTWSDWYAPTTVFSEEGSFAGHVDAPAGAEFFQYRLASMDGAPTWVNVDAIEHLPPPIEPITESDLGVAQQELTADSIPIHSRAEWGARPPQCSSGTNTAITRATIHHTVTPTVDSMGAKKRLRQIQAFHMFSRGWCDIGYNFLVSRDGRVWRGRGKNVVGAHVANNNTNNVGISFMGTYTSTKANLAQRCRAAKLLAWLHEKHPALHLNRTDVRGHREFGGTSCPGNSLYNQIGGILSLAKQGGCN
jgi:hypothetical protein